MSLNLELALGYLDVMMGTGEEININDEVFFQQHEEDTGSSSGSGGMSGGSTYSSGSSTLSLGQSYRQSTASTTPEFTSPPKHRPVGGSSFSLPIDQLNLLSLRSMSSSQPSNSPSPEYNLYSAAYDKAEEKTINPRKLLNDIGDGAGASSASTTTNGYGYGYGLSIDGSTEVPLSSCDGTAVGTGTGTGTGLGNGTGTGTGAVLASKSNSTESVFVRDDEEPRDGTNYPEKTPVNQKTPVRGYILPSSSLSPSLTSFFQGGDKVPPTKAKSFSVSVGSDVPPVLPTGNKFDLIMNNECLNAILYWINDTLQNVNLKINDNDEILGGAEEIMVNPTGIIKSNYYKRRNSIQVMNSSGSANRNLAGRTSMANKSPPTVDHCASLAMQKRKRRKSYNSDFSISVKDEAPRAISPGDVSSIQASPHLIGTTTSTINTSTSIGTNGSITGSSTGNTGTGTNTTKTHADSHVPADDDDEKPFPCPDCSKQFKRSEHLKRHIRSVHSNIRPFHCKHCEKKFSRSDNLAQHLKTHYKLNGNGTTTIIYGNTNLHNRGVRKKLSD